MPTADFSPFAKKLKAAKASSASISAFRRSYQALLEGGTGLIAEDSIEPVTELPKAECPSPEIDPERAKALLAQTCILKLNGGLGTSMGLDRAKVLLRVKENLTFLDLICRQVLLQRKQCNSLAFLLMNSFSTSADTRQFIERNYPQLGKGADLELLQNKVPKIDAATFAPATADDPELEWCPPGHGDLYAALAGSGRLEELLAKGIRTLFVSNADNLGATLNLSILDHFVASGAPFLMEVTKRTKADRKGGHLCRDRKDRRLRLREVAQCPESDLEAFQDISRHCYFNTNNLWIDLEQLKQALAANDDSIPLPVIFNSKTVDPRNKNSAKVIQLETAMGAAIETFKGAAAIEVPRSRFIPVKTTNDLLVLRSDAYALRDDSQLCATPGATHPTVDLDPAHYNLIDQFEQKIAQGVPSLKSCRSLKVKGPVAFSSEVIFTGDITLTNPSEAEQSLAPGTYTDQTVELPLPVAA